MSVDPRLYSRSTLFVVVFFLSIFLIPVCVAQQRAESDAHVVYWDARSKMQRMLWLIEDAINAPNDINVLNLVPLASGADYSDLAPYFEGLDAGGSDVDLRLERVEAKANGYEINVRIVDENQSAKLATQTSIEVKPDYSFAGPHQLLDFVTEVRGVVAREHIGLRSNEQPQLALFDSLFPTDYTSEHLFRPSILFSNSDVTLPRLTHTTSQDELDADLFNRPFGIAGFVFIDPIFSNNLMVITDANWDRVVAADRCPGWLSTFGEHGTGQFRFSNPTGIAFTTWRYIVTDSYNARASVYEIGSRDNPNPTFVCNLTDSLSFPIDVAATEFRCPEDLPACFISYFAVLDQENNNVRVYKLGLGGSNTVTYEDCYPSGLIDFQLNKPTSLSFGRHLLTHEGTQTLYVADAGNNRVVAFNIRQPYPAGYQVFETPSEVFPENAYLSCVTTDNNGYVYVLDKANSKIYKLSFDLSTLIATWGSNGTADGQMYYPNRISWPRAFQFIDGGDIEPDDMEAQDAGDALLTEFYSDDTGVRRLLQGVDIIAKDVEYQPSYPNFDHDYVHIKWWQTDVTNYGEVEIWNSDYTVNHTAVLADRRCGDNRLAWELPVDAPDDTYSYRVRIDSPYGDQYDLLFGSFELERYTDTTTVVNGILVTGTSIAPYDDSDSDSCFYIDDNRLYEATISDAWYGDVPSEKSLQFKWYGLDPVDGGVELEFYYLDEYGAVQQYPNSPDTVSCTPPELTASSTILFKMPDIPSSGTAGSNRTIVWCNIDTLHDGQTPSKDDCGDCYGRTVSFSADLHYRFCTTVCSDEDCLGVGCPTLHYWRDGEYWFENNILSQSEVDTINQNHIDRFSIVNASMIRPGEYEFMIAEEEQEITHLDRIEVSAIDVPVGTAELFTSSGNDVIAVIDTAIPISAKLADGTDVLSVVMEEDSDYLIVDTAGLVDVEFYFDQGVAGKGGTDLPPIVVPIDPPDKTPTNKPDGTVAYNWYRLSAQDTTGEWVAVSEVYPRQRTAVQYVSVEDYVFNCLLKLRLEWSERIRINHLQAVAGRTIESEQVDLEPLWATHSFSGNVSNKLLTTDGSYALVEQDQDINLCYKATTDPPEGYERVFFVETEGWYEGEDEEKPDPFTSGKQSVDPKFNPNYPNPFNPSTTFSFSLPSPAQVKLEIFNILGQKVSTVVDREYPTGDHVVNWSTESPSGKSLATGIYLARFSVGAFTATRKLVVLK